MCTYEVTHELKTGKETSASRRATAGGYIHELNAASRAGFARLVTRDTGNVLDLYVLSLVAVRRFLSLHIEEACERSCEQCLFEGHSDGVW